MPTTATVLLLVVASLGNATVIERILLLAALSKETMPSNETFAVVGIFTNKPHQCKHSFTWIKFVTADF
jgi:hypothetical protein